MGATGTKIQLEKWPLKRNVRVVCAGCDVVSSWTQQRRQLRDSGRRGSGPGGVDDRVVNGVCGDGVLRPSAHSPICADPCTTAPPARGQPPCCRTL